MLTILLVEKHSFVREGIRRILETEHDMEIVAEAEGSEEALDAVKHSSPDVTIIDITLTEDIEAIRRIKTHCPTTAVLTLCVYDDDPYIRAVLDVGAAGLLRKDGHGQELITALRAVGRGEVVLPAEVGETMRRKKA